MSEETYAQEVKEKDPNYLYFDDPDFVIGKHRICFDRLKELGHDLHSSSKCMVDGWSNKRLGADMFPVRTVQPLFNFAREALFAIKDMKRRCIKAGIAYYNEDGDFKWNETGKECETDNDQG